MGSQNRCKVDDVVERYGIEARGDQFDSVDEELLARWTGENGHEPQGYRSLAAWFNRHLLRSVYRANGRLTVGTRLEDEFETLVGDDDIAREELLDELANDGIDSRELYDSLVSFSTLRRHLIGCLDGEKETKTAETDWERDSVEIATEQLREKVNKALSSYENKGEITRATESDVSIQIHLSCPECPTRRTLSDALRTGYVCEDHLTDE